MPLAVALIPSICFGFNALLVGRTRARLRQQVLGVATGALIVGLVSAPLFHASYTPGAFGLCLLAGVVCALGNALLYSSFRLVGLAFAMPLTAGQQLFGLSFFGVVLFGDWATTAARLYGFVALVLLVIGTTCTVYRQGHSLVRRKRGSSPAGSAERGRDLLDGFARVSAASACYILYPLLVQAGPLQGPAVGLPILAGVFVGTAALTLAAAARSGGLATLASRKLVTLVFSGLLWGFGVTLMLVCNQRLGVASAFPLSQLGIIISSIGSITWLHEQRTKRELVLLTIGLILLVAGAFLIGAAKGADA